MSHIVEFNYHLGKITSFMLHWSILNTAILLKLKNLRYKQHLSFALNKNLEKKQGVEDYLRSKNDSTFFQEERKVAGKVDASCKPPSRRYIKLSTSLISKGLEIKNGILEGNGIQCFTISHSTKLGYGHTMGSWFQCQLIITQSILFTINFDSIAQCQ